MAPLHTHTPPTPPAVRIKSQVFSNGTEGLVDGLLPVHLLALDAGSLQVSSCHAEFLRNPQAFLALAMLLLEHPSNHQLIFQDHSH